jgi:hypothetical protein
MYPHPLLYELARARIRDDYARAELRASARSSAPRPRRWRTAVARPFLCWVVHRADDDVRRRLVATAPSLLTSSGTTGDAPRSRRQGART